MARMDRNNANSITCNLGFSGYRTPDIRSSRLKSKDEPNEGAILEVEVLTWMCGEHTMGGIAGVIGMACLSLVVWSSSTRAKHIRASIAC